MSGFDCKGGEEEGKEGEEEEEEEEEEEVTKLGQTNETQSAIVYRSLMPMDVEEVND